MFKKTYAIIEYESYCRHHSPWIVETGPRWRLLLTLDNWIKSSPDYAFLAWFSPLRGVAEILWTAQIKGVNDIKTVRMIVQVGSEYAHGGG